MDRAVQQTLEGTTSAWRNGSRVDSSTRGAGLAVAGGILGAMAASSCCILPLAFFSLGVSGAWIGNLTVLAPYQPIFIALTLGFLGFGFYRVYWRPQPACADGEACARPLSNQMTKIGLWIAVVLVLAALIFPYTARLFIDLS